MNAVFIDDNVEFGLLFQKRIEEIKKLSLYEQIETKDLLHYRNLQKMYDSYQISLYDNIVYEDGVYRLDIIYEGDNLKNVFFLKKDGDVAVDIRNGIIENILKDKVSMRDYMEYTLPEEMSEGKYDPFLGSGGGTPFFYNHNPELIIGASEIHWRTSGIFENGSLVGVTSFANHAAYGESSMFPHSVPCVITSIVFDVYNEEAKAYAETSKYWYAFWSIEGSIPVYSLGLDADYFNFNEFQEIIKSVTFTKRAFIIDYKEKSDDKENSENYNIEKYNM